MNIALFANEDSDHVVLCYACADYRGFETVGACNGGLECSMCGHKDEEDDDGEDDLESIAI